MKNNIMLVGDTAKCSSYKQYNTDIDYISTYIEARQSTHKGIKNITFLGLQAFVKRYLCDPITLQGVDDAEKIILSMGVPFNRTGWERVVSKHNGYLPVNIKAIPEGSVVPTGTPLVQVLNTDPQLPWVSNYIESALLRSIWYPSTVGTFSRELKSILHDGLMDTVGDVGMLDNMVHNVNIRSNTSNESTALCGLGHRANFTGCDSIQTTKYLLDYYNTSPQSTSYPTSEHNTVTANGMQNELLSFENMFDKFEGGFTTISCVSDTYNIYDAINEYWGGILKFRVISYGENGGVLIIRPDSGDIFEDPSVAVECVESLMDKFGSFENKAGYRTLPKYLKIMLECDWSNLDYFTRFIKIIKKKNIALDNFRFGIDGGIYDVSRQDFNFVINCSMVQEDGTWRYAYKNPFHRGKKSKSGVFTSVNLAGKFTTGDDDKLSDTVFKTVYRGNGKLSIDDTFSKISKRSHL